MANLLNEEERNTIHQFYVKDENSIPCSYTLNEKCKTDHAASKTLSNLFEKLALDENIDNDVWQILAPGESVGMLEIP